MSAEIPKLTIAVAILFRVGRWCLSSNSKLTYLPVLFVAGALTLLSNLNCRLRLQPSDDAVVFLGQNIAMSPRNGQAVYFDSHPVCHLVGIRGTRSAFARADVTEQLQRAKLIIAVGVGIAICAAWMALLGYGLFRAATTVF